MTENNKETIESLWKQLPNSGEKSQFIELCATKFKRSRKTIKQYWFSKHGFWSVPDEFKEEVIELLKTEVKKHLPVGID